MRSRTRIPGSKGSSTSAMPKSRLIRPSRFPRIFTGQRFPFRGQGLPVIESTRIFLLPDPWKQAIFSVQSSLGMPTQLWWSISISSRMLRSLGLLAGGSPTLAGLAVVMRERVVDLRDRAEVVLAEDLRVCSVAVGLQDSAVAWVEQRRLVPSVIYRPVTIKVFRRTHSGNQTRMTLAENRSAQETSVL